MPCAKNEIIADVTAYIRRSGGNFSAWCVGTARDWHCPVLEAHQIEEKEDGLICREAYTPETARAVRDYFVTQRGTTCVNGAPAQDGKLVYVQKQSPPQVP